MKDSAEFFLRDYGNTLFPLKTNRLLIEKYASGVRDFIQETALADGGSFQNQHRVFASKGGWFLRRTVKLDPVAEFFLYDIVYRNRSSFRRIRNPQRKTHGFQIASGEPISTLSSYGAFKESVSRFRRKFRHCLYVDVASYFNHIYHHDLVRWFEDIGATPPDVQAFGKFLREIVGGRSVDCLPHGLYPAKMIGSHFLSFIEESNRIRSGQSVRLMDDIWLFDDNINVLEADFLLLQGLLSDRGLSINEKKTRFMEGYDADSELPGSVDAMKIRLLRKRRAELLVDDEYGDEDDGDDGDDGDEDQEHGEDGEGPVAEPGGDDADDPSTLDALTSEEQEYLISLLKPDSIAEEDAELVLTLMRDHSSDISEYIPALIRGFPALTKKIYQFCGHLDDVAEVAIALLDHLKSSPVVTESQLFWFGMIVEDHLLGTPKVGELLRVLYESDRATVITKAKILEIPEKRFGLPDLRDEQLRNGQSDWLAWAAAVGARVHPKGQRNQILKYFRRSSQMNLLIGEFVERCFD